MLSQRVTSADCLSKRGYGTKKICRYMEIPLFSDGRKSIAIYR